MTYTELAAHVESWLNRENFTELVAEIPTFFILSQERINLEPTFKLYSTLTTATIDTATPTIPADYSKPYTFTIIEGTSRYELNSETLKIVKSVQGSGRPYLVAPVGSEFVFGPTADSTYDVELIYFPKLTPISPSNATNELSDLYPSLILFATLLEACLWLKDDQRAAVWEGRYRDTLSKIHAFEEKAEYEDGSLQVRPR